MDSDCTLNKETLSHIGLKDENNVVSVRRLEKSFKPDSSERRLCHPLLITANTHHLMGKCFERCHKLHSFKFPAYIKKYLSPGESEIEKKNLAKGYDLITVESKNRKDFHIKKLELFFKNDLVEMN